MGDELYGPRGGVAMAGAAAADDGERAAIGAFSQRFLAMSRDAIILAVAGVADGAGLFTALAEAEEPLTCEALASAAGCHPRYVLEICSCLACGEFIEYDKGSETFSIAPAQAKCLTDPRFPIGVVSCIPCRSTLPHSPPFLPTAPTPPHCPCQLDPLHPATILRAGGWRCYLRCTARCRR